jgi:hypothetical protein
MHENNGIQQDPQSQFLKQTPTARANSSPQFGALQRGMTEKLHCTLFWTWSLPDHHWQLKMTTGQLGKQARFKETLASHWMGSVTWSSWILLLRSCQSNFFSTFQLISGFRIHHLRSYQSVFFSTFQLISGFRIHHLRSYQSHFFNIPADIWLQNSSSEQKIQLHK